MNLIGAINLHWADVKDTFVPPALIALAAIPIMHRSGLRSRTIALVLAIPLTVAALYLFVMWLALRNFSIE